MTTPQDEPRRSERAEREKKRAKPPSPKRVPRKNDTDSQAASSAASKAAGRTRQDKNQESQEQVREQLDPKLVRNQQAIKPLTKETGKYGSERIPKKKPPSRLKRASKHFQNARKNFRGDWGEKGFKESLDTHAKGLGSLLERGLSRIIGKKGAKGFFSLMDKAVKKPIALLISLIVLVFIFIGGIIFLLLSSIFLIIVLIATVLIVLFVPDDKVDLGGIDLAGISSEGIHVDGLELESSAKGGIATPSNLRGKFLALYANTSPFKGLFMDWRGTRYHYGTDYDYSGDKGKTPIYPAAEGVVYAVSSYSGGGCGASGTATYGHYVTIEHPDIIGENGKPFVTRYAHMKEPASVKVGQKVYLNTVLGYIGSTGCSSGPHIHFELIPEKPEKASQKKGVDPDKYLTCSADGKTISETRSKLKGSKYNFDACFEYQKKVRGVQ